MLNVSDLLLQFLDRGFLYDSLISHAPALRSWRQPFTGHFLVDLSDVVLILSQVVVVVALQLILDVRVGPPECCRIDSESLCVLWKLM